MAALRCIASIFQRCVGYGSHTVEACSRTGITKDLGCLLDGGRSYFPVPPQETQGLAGSCIDVVIVGVPAQVLFNGDAKVLCSVSSVWPWSW